MRELKNSVEHALILARGGTVGPEHLPSSVAAAPGAPGNEQAIAELIRKWVEARLQNGDDADDLYQQLLSLVEPPLLAAVLEKHRGGRAAAARTLGMHRMTLRKKLNELGIAHDD